MADDFSSTNLFDNFGLSTPEVKKAVHTRFVSDDDDDDNSYVQIIDEVDSSAHESPSVGDVVNSTPKMKEDSVEISVPMKFIDFLKRIAGPGRENLNEQLNYLMKTYEESENTKLSSDLGFRLDSRPMYDTTLFSSTYDGETKPAADSMDAGAPKMSCFNCEGEHSVNDCTQPRDQQRINRNKSINRAKQQRRTQDSNRRYAEDNSKYAHLKPGVISDDLRRALGLKHRELPLWIYQMRILGYPPGHLIDAFSQPSNLTMFDDNNCPLGATVSDAKSFYDVSRIIEYPGFNVPLSSKVVDEYLSYNMPPMLPHQQKQAFVDYLNSHLESVDNDSTHSARKNGQEREFSNKINVLPMDISEDDVIPPPLPPTPQTSVGSTPGTVSPSESDLERKRQDILDQLNSPTHSSSVDGIELNGDSSLKVNVDEPKSADAVDDACFLSPNSELILVDHCAVLTPESSSALTITRSLSSQSLSVALGTPTLPPSSAKKPRLECFRQDVNEFEPKEETPPCRGGGMKKIKELLSKGKRK